MEKRSEHTCEEISYTWYASDRRSVGLRILPDGAVEVRTPLSYTESQTREMVRAHITWIRNKRAEAMLLPSPRRITWGAFLYCGGKLYPLTAHHGAAAWNENGLFLPWEATASYSRQAEAMHRLYTQLTEDYYIPRTMALARKWGLVPDAITVTGAQKRWGSCSGRANIHFSRNAALLSPAVGDYLICHELTHLEERNHSARFWARVEARMPDYQERVGQLRAMEKWLRQWEEF